MLYNKAKNCQANKKHEKGSKQSIMINKSKLESNMRFFITLIHYKHF